MSFELRHISLSSQPFDVTFVDTKTSNYSLCAGTINGTLELFSYNTDSNTTSRNWSIDFSKQLTRHNTSSATDMEEQRDGDFSAIRCCASTISGSNSSRLSDSIVCGSFCGSLSIVDIKTGKVSNAIDKAHDGTALNRVASLGDANGVVASGDDNGVVRLWDINRIPSPTTSHAPSSSIVSSLKTSGLVGSFRHHSDFISDLYYAEYLDSLLVTSGDGSLSVIDLRKTSEPVAAASTKVNNKKKKKIKKKKVDDVNDMSMGGKLTIQSENAEDELLSIVAVKNGKKVVCGTQQGILAIYSWNDMSDMSDRFPGHPHSVDAIVKLDEDTIITGSSDGMLRVVQIHPNKLLGLIGEHDDYPIERLGNYFTLKFYFDILVTKRHSRNFRTILFQIFPF